MSAPLQMTAQTLNALKGWPNLAAVDHVAPLAAAITDRVPAGSCVSLNSSGEFVLGVGTTNKMPMFTFAASDDPDISNDGGDPATEAGVYVGITPGRTGGLLAFVGNNALELVSTNYDTDNPGNYTIGAWLTSPTTTALAGKLVTGTLGTHTIVGQVSRGIVDNGYGVNAVSFFTSFHPVYP